MGQHEAKKEKTILSASLQKIPHTLRIKNGSRRCTGRAGGPHSADLRHLRNGACLSFFKTHARYTTKTHALFFSFYRFRGFSFHRRRSNNAAAEEEEFRRLVVYFASCLFSLSLSTIPCLFRGGHDVVRVFLTFLFISLMLCDDKHAGVRDGNVNRGDERCLQSCEMARLLQVRRVQRDEV